MNFYRVQHNTIMSGLVVRYITLGRYTGQISASRDGICLQGNWPIFGSESDIRDVANVLERARAQYVSISNSRAALDFKFDPDCVTELHAAVFGGDDKIVEVRARQIIITE